MNREPEKLSSGDFNMLQPPTGEMTCVCGKVCNLIDAEQLTLGDSDSLVCPECFASAMRYYLGPDWQKVTKTKVEGTPIE